MANLRPGEIGTFTLRVSQAPQYQHALCFPADKLELHREAGGLNLRTLEGDLVARIPRRHTRSMVAFLNCNPHRHFTAEVVRVSRNGLWVRFGVVDPMEMELPELTEMTAHPMVC